MDKNLNLVRLEEISRCQDDHLVGLNDSSSREIGPPDDASNSEKASFSLSEDLKQIKDRVMARFPSKLKIITIVGMGGIGKTYLAKNIYTDTEISYHFYVLAWITVSQEYNLRNVLLGLLRSFTSLPHEVSQLTDEQLVEVLYRNLKGRRYLIVLDDLWSIKIWNDFKPIFPNDDNGSRIILTSRFTEVAAHADPDSPPYRLNCLSNDDSWWLLQNQLFAGKTCPPDLVEIGKKIAKKCQGLPLAVVVVAGQLSKIDKNKSCWADVVKRLDSLVSSNQEEILDILCWSYNYLPQHLKSCFIYMATFPKNSMISVPKLLRLWSAEGLLHKEWEENLEDAAEKCLDDLVSRNLIMVTRERYNGTPKTCGVHDLLWDLSFREAEKAGHCFHCLSNFNHFDATTDSMFIGTYTHFLSSLATHSPLTSTRLRQLRVLDIHIQFLDHFPEEIMELVNLRYLELATCSNIPGSVAKLQNLETLINSHAWAGPILPKEIWLLPGLRHLHVGSCTFLPDASGATADDGRCVSILPDLETLSTISFASCRKQVFSSIPSLKTLKLHEMGEEEGHLFDCLNNLVYLHHLEKLNMYFSKEIKRRPQNLCLDIFPPSIRQLTLTGSHLQWEDINIIAMLPNLEVLKLKKNAFKGPVCEQTFEGFPRLKILLFEDLDLEHWIANTIPFPILQRLVLRSCYFVEGIPYCLGEIPTLESIELFARSSSVEESAKTIQQEQQSMGNYDLQVCIHEMASTTLQTESRRPARFKKVVFKLELFGDKTTISKKPWE